jgi:hypothetical protein
LRTLVVSPLPPPDKCPLSFKALAFVNFVSQGLAATIKYFASINLSDYDDHLKPLIMAIEKK